VPNEGDDKGGRAAPRNEEGDSGTVVPCRADKAGIFAHGAETWMRPGHQAISPRLGGQALSTQIVTADGRFFAHIPAA